LSLPHLFAARANAAPAPADSRREAPAKACILLYMLGGPPQQETFDMKPESPGSARSLFKSIATNVPGIEVCELLPDLAMQADKLAIIRSVFHGGNALFHGAGVHYNLTGWPNFPREGEPFLDRRDHPSIGAVLNQLRPTRNGFATVHPTADVDHAGRTGTRMAGQHAGFLGRKYDPHVMDYRIHAFGPGHQHGSDSRRSEHARNAATGVCLARRDRAAIGSESGWKLQQSLWAVQLRKRDVARSGLDQVPDSGARCSRDRIDVESLLNR
jgi:hypothetical protein